MFARFARLAGAVGAAAVVAGVMATGSAHASIVGDRPSPEQVGYSLTGAQFEKVVAVTYLRNAGQYAPELSSYGASVQLLTPSRQITLGMSAVTSGGGSVYSPGLAVFDRAGTAPTDLVFSGNGQFGSFSAPAGHTVRESMFYAKQTGVVHATVLDVTTGQAVSATYDIGLGAHFREVAVGHEVGCYSDTDPRVVGGCGSDVTSPHAAVKLGTFSGLVVENYLNKNFTNLPAAYFQTGPVIMTSNGQMSGTLLASPSAFSQAGSSFSDLLTAH